jgi:hypothetical protein
MRYKVSSVGISQPTCDFTGFTELSDDLLRGGRVTEDATETGLDTVPRSARIWN